MPQPNVEAWLQGLRIGQYVLVRELARGGMGEIWLARQTGAAGFDRLVVLKRVLQSQDEDPESLTMFLDEARIASQLHHPNIVQIFELQQDAGSAFLVMEYLPGQTMNRLVRRMVEAGTPMPAGIAVSICAAAAKGLGYAHRRKDLEGRPLHIVHRDVSPQNLFITYDGQVKVLDFGIALAAGRMARTSTGAIKGKVAYMSPEQALGEPITAASDVYALGIVLFEALTSTRYYGKLDEISILRQLSMKKPAVLPSSRAAVDARLEASVLRALSPEPGERFSDGQVFFEALDGWLRAHPVATSAVESAMSAAFHDEIRFAGEIHRTVGTPVSASNSSMPDGVSVTRLSTKPTAPAQPPGRMSARPRWVLAALTATVAGAIALFSFRSGPAQQPAKDAAPLDTFTDDAPVAECSEAAKRAYREALRITHDVGSRAAEPRWELAAAADPDCATTQLRGMLVTHVDAARRRAFERARAMRGRLPPREAALLDAFAPAIMREPSDHAATAAALAALADAHPADAELQVIASRAALDDAATRRFAERARDLDPGYSDAWVALIDVAFQADDPDEVRAAIEACGANVPSAIGCAEARVDLATRMNDCGGLERESRAFNLRADEKARLGYTGLAFGRGTLDPSSPLVDEAIDQWDRRRPGPDVLVAETWRIGKQIALGDFRGAEAALAALESRVSSAQDLEPHVRVGALQFELEVERGNAEAAARFAVDFLARTGAWNRPVRSSGDNGARSYFEPRMGSAVLASSASDRWSREAWEVQLAKTSPPKEVMWAYGTAMFVRDEASARAAMRDAPARTRLPYPQPHVEALIGRVALLAGDVDRAVFHLGRAASRCDALAYPFEHVRASLLLGQARELANDREGACRAYAFVLSRWGHATSPSVTAKEARGRTVALGCTQAP